ncbi:MAG: serine/threonine-protein kinase [Synechococcales bacterium]|nr:serine/threonine-protein kinase [Synechococcales bacterium]
MIGQILGDRYEIREQLGKKAGRQTLLAWDRHQAQPVVIKLLTFSQDFVWDDLKLFEREAETLRSLSHPAIPRYLDFFEIAQPPAHQFALVQSYAAGQSLNAHLRAGHSFQESEVTQLAIALLEILVYLHSRHPPVIHRDIKPSNILLTHRSGCSVGEVHLVDFGSVQTLAATEGGTITIVGTYGYMPPEQFGGRTSPASDLYGLGATLIYLVTGRHPADLPQRQLRLEFEPLANLSPGLTRWLARLVEPSLDRRFTSAAVALRKLESLSQPMPVWGEQPVQPEEKGVAIAQPPNSQIQLSQSADHFTVQFPTRFTEKAPNPSPFFRHHWMWLTASVCLFVAQPELLVFLLFLWGGGAGTEKLVLKGLTRSHSQTQRLTIDSQQITLDRYENDALHSSCCSPRNALVGIEYCSGHEGYHSLKIWADQPYEFGSNSSITAADLQWLAQELGNWLAIPVQHTSQHLPLPRAMFRKGPPKLLPKPAPVEKPAHSPIVLLKRPNWIDILVPADGSPTADAHTRLYIDHQQIHQAHAFGDDPPPSLRVAIRAIEYHSGDDTDGFLRVWAGKQNYDLGRDIPLSPEELRWLVYELGDWLKVPIYRH